MISLGIYDGLQGTIPNVDPLTSEVQWISRTPMSSLAFEDADIDANAIPAK